MNRLTTLAASAGLAATVACSVPATASTEELAFDVLLDGDPIGSHVFRIDDLGDERRVHIHADFDVRVLFVPVYRYRHRNQETWRDGCLATIASQTDANGTPYQVDGQDDGAVFRVQTRDATRRVDSDCVMTFAYWDRRFLDQDRLLNAQTGDLVDVDVQRLGRQTLGTTDGVLDVVAYRIVSAADDVDITVYYDSDSGRWVSLTSMLDSGRVMRYLPSGSHPQVSRNDGDNAPRRGR